MQRTLIKYLLLFFIPVILGVFAAELLTRGIPESYRFNAERLEEDVNEIEVLVIGSSQMLNAVDAAQINKPAINLASGDQHHDTDFKLAKALLPRMPKLKTVVLEASYNHFELSHNGKDFWKNTVYLDYYGVNNFERATYFKDRSLFLSQHTLFSEMIVRHYVQRENESGFNRFGFDTLNFDGTFQNLDYNETIIAKGNFKINLVPNLENFRKNEAHFLAMLAYFKVHNIDVIVCTVPMYKTFVAKRVPEILLRRNSLIEQIKKQHPEVVLLNLEEDTLQYGVQDYINQSHLNPKGAKKFTATLSSLLQEQD